MSQVRSPLPGTGPAPRQARRRPAMRIVDAHASGETLDAETYALDVAAVLRERGVGAGHRVLLKADNSALYAAALLALVHLDASIVVLDGQQTTEETHRLARIADLRFALLDDHAQAPANIGSLSMSELALTARQVAEESPDATPRKKFSAEKWRSRSDSLVLWSSGTTGEPKGVVKSGRAFLENLERTRRLMGYRDDDVLLPLLPFSHQYGLSLILLAWIAGGSLLVAPYTRLDRALALGALHGATVVDATPATYRSVLNLRDRRPGLLSGLDRVRMWCTGGAPMDRDLGRHFLEAIGAPLLDGYGSTEAGNVAFATAGNPAGCGQTLDGIEVCIAGEDRRHLPPGQVGEIWLRTPDLMEGYLTGEGELTGPRPGPYRTGDLGYLDEEGNLYVLGRKSAVHRMGHTLYPEVLERKAEACGRPVKIIPLEDARRGHELVFVVEDPASGDPLHWRERLCALLAPFEEPNHVLVVDRFPLNCNGKTDVSGLAAHVSRSLARRVPARAHAADRTE
ncbi:class I adenylate-forming enzyme family protein [Streptomyces tubercidicus]|uniref:class I adenylate-forming enzyme family protein n=1 Tax=Streptomyces tubercidicus TaxID=47759 RepID=UPI0036ABC7E5